MFVHISVPTLLAILWTRFVSAFPHARHQPPPQQPSPAALSRLTPSAHLTSNLSLPLRLSSPPSSPPNINLMCYDPSPTRQAITIELCRPTLRLLRQFPSYATQQRFKEYDTPRLPQTPPYIINAEDTSCAIEISSRLTGLEDKFSFKQARELATEILEECSAVEKGFGGQATIGVLRNAWWVKVVGYEDEGNGAGNGTSMSEVLRDASGDTSPVNTPITTLDTIGTS